MVLKVVQLAWLRWENLKLSTKIKQAKNDLPGLSPSDSESVSGSVVSGAKVTFFSLLTPSEGGAVNKFYRALTTELTKCI